LTTENFFVLSSGIAEDVLQKIVNCQFRIAIYGDYPCYKSKSLVDIIYERNKGRDVFFTENSEQTVEKLFRIE